MTSAEPLPRDGQVARSLAAFLVVLSFLAATLGGCARAPEVPADDAATYQRLVGENGQEYLKQISSHRWNDGGEAVASRLAWIAHDANSPQEDVSQHAGEAAHAIAVFLDSNKDELSRLPAGWFGLKHRPLGQLNPELTAGFATVLTPYQGALIGDVKETRGFEIIDVYSNNSSGRNIFAVIDTSMEAGKTFSEAAFQRVHAYLREYGQAIAKDDNEDLVTIRRAAELAGVVEAGRRESGNTAVPERRAQYWINWAGYEVAAALGARPGDRDIGSQFFDSQGRLLSPDSVPRNDMRQYATAVANFSFNHGLPDLGSRFDHWFDDAAGK